MTYAQFYDQIAEILENRELYWIGNTYEHWHIKAEQLIEEIEKSKNKQHDNFRYKYLPKQLDLNETVAVAVVSDYRRFIDETKKYQEKLKELKIDLKKGQYIGYWTNVCKAILYTKDRKSLGQFVVPKKGLYIPQQEQIEIHENDAIRQRRSDAKYANLKLIDKIIIGNEQKQIWG